MSQDIPLSLLAPGLPNVVSVELTNSCNLECPMCPRSLSGVNVGEPKSLLPESAWNHLLEVALPIGHVNLNGLSENFLHPRFLDLVEQLGQLGVATSFSTNGTLVTPKVAARIAGLRTIETINVSIDSADPEEYRRIRGGDLNRVRQGLVNLVAATQGSVRITASAVVMKMGRRGLPMLPAFLCEVGIRNLVLQAVVDPENTSSDQELPEDATAVVAEIKREGARLGVEVLAVPYLEDRMGNSPVVLPAAAGDAPRTKMCTSPWEHIAIDYQGRVFPCCNSPSWQNLVGVENAVMGDISTSSFQEVWAGPTFRKFRKGLLSGELPALCRICPVVAEGAHPFSQVRAELVLDACRSTRTGVKLVARNVGQRAWTAESPVMVAPARPRDRASGLATPRWRSWNRVAAMSETRVEVGQVATFDLPLARWRTGRREIFQLLVEGLCWLPNTEFAVVPVGRWVTAWPLLRRKFRVEAAPASLAVASAAGGEP
jgi:MoaA/NifB/PqqE/SkfB family radical SAM enzyme